jgi:hypothetical protein
VIKAISALEGQSATQACRCRSGAGNAADVPRLKEDCGNFLYEFKNFFRELLDVFNVPHGTDCDEAREWTLKSKKHTQPVIEHAAEQFGADTPNRSI